MTTRSRLMQPATCATYLQACQVLYTVSTVNISDGSDGINMRLKIKLGWSYCWLAIFGRLEKELETV